MTSHVFANGREVLCAVSTGTVIAAFPDVCLSPPGPPAGPIPIPYPNFAKAADVANGSRQVFIKGKPVIKRSSSYIKKITGDEAATRNFGGSVITHTITGTAWFQSWSPNVYVEGEEVVRHLDLCTTNHGSTPGSAPPMPAMASMSNSTFAVGGSCGTARKAVADNCEDGKPSPCPDPKKLDQSKKNLRTKRKQVRADNPDISDQDFSTKTADERADTQKEYQAYAKELSRDDCRNALRCGLSSYKKTACCPPQTPHHVVDVSSFLLPGERKKGGKTRDGCEGYNQNEALCVCAEGNDNNTGTHGLLHLKQRQIIAEGRYERGDEWTFREAVACGVRAIQEIFPLSNCDPDCLTNQLVNNHKKMGITPGTEVACSPSGAREQRFGKQWERFNKNESAKLRNQTDKISQSNENLG